MCFWGKSCSDSQVWARNQESLHARGHFRVIPCSDSQVYPLKSRIDARWHCDDDLQAEPFSVAATKNRIGRGRSPSLRLLQAKPFFVAAKKISIGRGPRCHYDCSRRNHSSSRQRKLGSDADLVAATSVSGGPFSTATKIVLHRFPSLGPKSRIAARWRSNPG